jgi:hypothetical protein
VSENTRVIIRFTVNQGKTKTTLNEKRIKTQLEKVADIVVTNVAITYSNRNYQKLTANTRAVLRRAIRREIHFAAQQWSKIIGLRGSQAGPYGSIESKEEGAASFSLNQKGVWNPRSTRYLRDKKTQYKHTKWFYSTGLLKDNLSTGSDWESNFGPIQIQINRRITVERNGDRDPKGLTSTQKASRNTIRTNSSNTGLGYQARYGSKRISIATIHIRSLTNITPAMLPGLSSGHPSFEGNVSSLIKDEDVRARVAGKGPYRPTLEPFLSFVLTRAIPNAVQKKVAAAMNSTSK